MDEQGYLIFKHVLTPAEKGESFRSLYAHSQGPEVVEGQPGDVLVFNGHRRQPLGPDNE